MYYGNIVEAVEKLKKKYDEENPFKLCKLMKIKVLMEPLGTEEESMKGFYLESNQIRTITINCDLPEVIQNVIAAHELGHAVLHRKSGIHAFHEVSLFDESSRIEKDANLFAAEYLLDDDDVLEAMNSDNTFFAAAAALYVPAELLDFKFRVMKWKGYKLTEPPITARSNFLKNMYIPDIDDQHIC